MTEQLRTNPVRVAPSMMCADPLHFLDHARKLEAAGVHLWHMDVMDGHFAPNISMGLPLLEQFRGRTPTKVPYDVHLMVTDNDLFVDLVAPMCTDRGRIAVHVESCTHLDRTLSLIRDRGVRAGAAINPATPPDALRYVLDRLDYVLIMTVNPGYAGQKLVPSAIQKIADTRAMLDRLGRPDLAIEVDGNVSFQHVPDMVAAGADVLVAGTSSLFAGGATLDENVKKLNEAVALGLTRRGAADEGGVLV
jgi:ribulose-phosphate 3-epimerase